MSGRTMDSAARPPELGLFFFSSGEETGDAPRYDALLRSARFADAHGFSSLWVPERHFMELGALYPSPAVLLAAIARETTRIALRAGSVVLPLHHPVRVAEEWSVLDNLSGGRVGIACASGWHPDDFVLCPERYEGRRRTLPDDVALLRAMWRGESVRMTGGTGEPVEVRIRPAPVQPELPLWVTSAGTVETFAWAGRIGANLLTYLALHDPAGLREKIAIYREALAAHGHDPERHTVTVWVHVYLDDDDATARAHGLQALADYYTSDARRLFAGLTTHHARAGVDATSLPPDEFREYVRFVCGRMADRGMAVFGSPERCAESIARLAEVGVDEVACQLDFAVSPAQLPGALERLARVHRLLRDGAGADREPAPATVPPALESVRRRCRDEVDPRAFYATAERHGLGYGPAFRRVRRVWRTDGEALGWVRSDGSADSGAPDAADDGSPAASAGEDSAALDAALLDACLQVLLAATPAGRQERGGAPYFSGVREFRAHGEVGLAAWSHARLHPPRDGEPRDAIHGDVVVYDDAGRLLVEILGVRGGRITGPESKRMAEDPVAAAVSGVDAGDLSSLLYEVAWRRADAPAAGGAGSDARWLVVAAEEDAELAAALLGGGGGRHLRLEPVPDDPSADSTGAEFRLPDGLAAALDEGVPGRVVYLHPAGAGLAAPLRLVQALAGRGAAGRLYLVTRDGVAVSPGDEPSPEAAALWGFGRSVHHEQPRLGCTLVDAGAGTPAPLLRAVLASDGPERQLAVRGGGVFAARLARVDAGAPHPPVRLSRDASYLVTGGTGALGLRVAEWMAARGAGQLLLVARHAPGTEARRRIDRLAAAGTPVAVLAADVADARAMAGALRRAAETLPPVRGIVHAAGVLDDGVLEQQTPERIRAVLAPKAAGARTLHRLTAADPPGFFVCFSSVAAVLGSPAQAGYAAANTALDGFAHALRARGSRATSIAWGVWGDGPGGEAPAASGMSAALTEHRRAGLEAMGMGVLDPERAIRALEWALAHDVTQLCVLPFDWARLARADGTPFLAEVLPAAAPRAAGGELRRLLDAAASAERPAMAERYLRERVAEALRQEVARVDAHTPLPAFGVDSLMAIELRNRVAADAGVQVPLVRLMQDTTIAELAGWMCGEMEAQSPPPADAPAAAGAPLDARTAAGLLAGIGELPEGEVDALLERLLSVA